MTKAVLHHRFPADAAHLKPMRETVRHALQQHGVSDAQADRLVLGLNEACMNIIEHAYGEHHRGDIILNILEQDECLEFELIDFAPPVDVTCIQPRDLDQVRPGGLGTHFIKEVMDEVRYQTQSDPPGNCLQMRKYKFTGR